MVTAELSAGEVFGLKPCRGGDFRMIMPKLATKNIDRKFCAFLKN